jgi:hypothetical protein
MTKLCLAAVVAGLLAISLGSSAVAQGSPCDRGCLTGLVDSHVAAMVAHDPSRVAIARTVS